MPLRFKEELPSIDAEGGLFDQLSQELEKKQSSTKSD